MIIAASQLMGFIFRKMRQPEVVGQVLGGILLGPSFFGKYFPNLFDSVFPVASMGNIHGLSQIGLVFFMFILGMQIDFELIRKETRAAVVISQAGFILTFAMGVVLSYFLYNRFIMPAVQFYVFALFIGIAMSISAFPVMASILRSRKLLNSWLGNMALVCAATDDIIAWFLFTIMLTIIKGGSLSSVLRILLNCVLYGCGMLLIVRRLLSRALGRDIANGRVSGATFVGLLLVVLASALCSDLIGLHVMIGAFLVGTIIPGNASFKQLIIDKLEDICVTLLLPLYFLMTGLHTRIDMVNNADDLFVCLLIIVIAVSGKLFGSAIAARVMGMSWHTGLSIGVLMNTRGLVELIILNIGMELGIISQPLFTLLVIMALVTTCMTQPLLNVLVRLERKKPAI
jgi:Kef-type K+ transport system membrane component KefB